MSEAISESAPAGSRRPAGGWSPRESQLLAITLELLQQHGYDRLTVDQVAARAKASKTTLYRRWPSKADLVLAAFSEGIREVAVAPDTGTLRGDLISLGNLIIEQATRHAGTVTAVLNEMSRNPHLRAVLQQELVRERKELIQHVLSAAADRGEIDHRVFSEEIWDLLPAYLIFRCLIPGRPPTADTVITLVDDVLLPSLTRPALPD